MTWREVGEILYRRLPAIIAVGLVSFAIGLYVSLGSSGSYTARATVRLEQAEAAIPGDVGLLTQQKLNLQAITVANVIMSRDFVDAAGKASGVDTSGIDVTATAQQNTALIQLSVAGGSAGRASSLARALIDRLRATIDAGNAPRVSPTKVDTVSTPESVKSGTNPAAVSLAALISGLVVAAAVVLFASSPFTQLRPVDDGQLETG